jgi:hypothetical protein
MHGTSMKTMPSCIIISLRHVSVVHCTIISYSILVHKGTVCYRRGLFYSTLFLYVLVSSIWRMVQRTTETCRKEIILKERIMLECCVCVWIGLLLINWHNGMMMSKLLTNKSCRLNYHYCIRNVKYLNKENWNNGSVGILPLWRNWSFPRSCGIANLSVPPFRETFTVIPSLEMCKTKCCCLHNTHNVLRG